MARFGQNLLFFGVVAKDMGLAWGLRGVENKSTDKYTNMRSK
jgi:hypothetical protein